MRIIIVLAFLSLSICTSAQSRIEKVVIENSIVNIFSEKHTSFNPVSSEHPKQVTMSGKISAKKLIGKNYFVCIQARNRNQVSLQDTSDRLGNYQLRVYADSTYTFEFLKSDTAGLGEDYWCIVTLEIPKTDFVRDIHLNHAVSCSGTPVVFFREGSVEIDKKYSIGGDSVKDKLDFMVKMLKSKPNLVFEISGHLGLMELPDKTISLKRAEVVKSYFLSQGIATERLIARGCGLTKLRISQPGLNKLSTFKERVEMDKRNRRAVVRVLEADDR